MKNPILDRVNLLKSRGKIVKKITWPSHSQGTQFCTLLIDANERPLERVSFEADDPENATTFWVQARTAIAQRPPTSV